MKKLFFALFAAAMLLSGLTGCMREIDVKLAEQCLVGIWWDEYDYSDVTETGVPFDKVLLAVKADADHSGCIYLGLFDSKSDELVAVYGGPEEAGFKWELTSKGDIVLSDPVSGESTVLTKADGSSYGDNMTNVPGTTMTLSNNNLTLNNTSYSGTLTKADSGTEGEIKETLSMPFSALKTNLTDGELSIKGIPGNTWAR
ncbi:MAG: hypothetical protein II475_02190 [Bacteroidales bacterium]|jgi:hypothetical protein|nr:hypothetical protein [Bacteroidales bacterium]